MRIDYWQKLEEHNFYHLYTRSNSGELLFRNEMDFLFFELKWKRYLEPYLSTYAYCLLPNHFHFLVETKQIDEEIEQIILNEKTRKSIAYLQNQIGLSAFIEDQIKRLLSSYTLSFNRKYRRRGSLFSKRFKRVSLNNLDRVLYCQAYIHHNPIHHEYSAAYDQWKFSSFNNYTSNTETQLVLSDLNKLYETEDPLLAKIEFLKYHREFSIEKGIKSLQIDSPKEFTEPG